MDALVHSVPSGSPFGASGPSVAPSVASSVASESSEKAAPARWRIVAAVGIGVLLVLELVLGWHSLLSAFSRLSRPRWNWVAWALVAEIASMGTFARMQRALLRGAGTKVPVRRHIALAYAAHSLSATLPGGPVFSTGYNFRQMRRFGASAAAASWCIALSGVLSTVALVLIGAAGGVLTRSNANWSTLIGDVVLALVIAVTVRVLSLHPHWLKKPIRAVLRTVNRIRGRPAYEGRDRLIGFITQLRSVRIRPRDFTVAAALALANWLLDATCLWMCCVAVGMHGITVTALLIAYCAGMAAASVPIVPGGLGVVDGALILGLITAGLTSNGAIAAVVLYRLISFGFIIGMGWLIWLAIRYRYRETGP